MIGLTGVLVLGMLLAVATTDGWSGGRRVVVTGRVSRVPAQHLIDAARAADVVYVDVEDGGQVVAYVRGGIPAEGRVRLVADVLRVEGGAKRPGSSERYSESQLDVVSWEELAATDVGALLERLVSSTLDREVKSGVEEEIVSAGRAAVPVLLEHLDDGRTCWTDRTLLNEGELLNRPSDSPPVAERWAETTVTLGDRARDLLFRIVYPPDYVSPFARNAKPYQAGPFVRPFRVDDWPAFWEKRNERTLASIREEMKACVDAYWKGRGVEQEVK